MVAHDRGQSIGIRVRLEFRMRVLESEGPMIYIDRWRKDHSCGIELFGRDFGSDIKGVDED